MAGETKNHRGRMRGQQSGRVAEGNALKTSAMVQEFAKRDCELFDAGSTGTFNGSSSILSTINIPFMDNGSGTSIIMNNECTVSSVLNVGSTSTYVDLYAYAQITTGSVFSAQQGILTVIGIN